MLSHSIIYSATFPFTCYFPVQQFTIGFFWHFPFTGLYTTFIFQKPDPDVAPPIMTPLLQESSYNHDEASISNI
jgi:hypothetical protein